MQSQHRASTVETVQEIYQGVNAVIIQQLLSGEYELGQSGLLLPLSSSSPLAVRRTLPSRSSSLMRNPSASYTCRNCVCVREGGEVGCSSLMMGKREGKKERARREGRGGECVSPTA